MPILSSRKGKEGLKGTLFHGQRVWTREVTCPHHVSTGGQRHQPDGTERGGGLPGGGSGGEGGVGRREETRHHCPAVAQRPR